MEIKVRERKKKSKKLKPRVVTCDDIFTYDIKDYDGFSDDPDDLVDE